MTTSTQAIGVVSALQGKVFAHASNGKVRLLVLGDSVFANEVIVTASGAQVEITFFDHPTLFVEELQKLALDTLIAGSADAEPSSGVSMLVSSAAETVITDRTPAVETLNDTNARDVAVRSSGIADAETEAEGNNFVDLPRIGEALPIPEYAFPLNPPGAPPEIEGPVREAAVVEAPPSPTDDRPDARVTNPVPDRLTLDESAPGTDTATFPETLQLPAGLSSVTANLADNFASPIDYGDDGAGSVSFALNLVDAGGNGIASGMYALTPDSLARGESILLSMDGADVVGKAGGTVYFRISVNNDPLSADFGKLTFSQNHNIWHDNTVSSAGHADEAALLALVGGDKLSLVQTVTDVDGDQDSASIDLGSGVFSIQDSGPTAAVPNIVLANESGGYAMSAMFQPSTDPLFTADMSGNIPGWSGGVQLNDATGLTSMVGGNEVPIYFYVDPAHKETLYAYTDLNEPSVYGVGTDQSLIFTLTLDPAEGRIEVGMSGKIFSSNVDTNASFISTPISSQTILYVNENGLVSTAEPEKILFSADSLQNDFSGNVQTTAAGLFAVGATGDTLPTWTNGGEILVFDFDNAQLDFSFNPNFVGLFNGNSATIAWTVFSSVSGYSESGVMTATEGAQNMIMTSIGSIDKVWLQADTTAFAIQTIRTSRESDITKSFTAGVIDNDGSQSDASFTVKFEGSRDVTREDAELADLQTIGGLGGSALNETLRGTSGDEHLTGGAGNDVMVGGGGADTFVWRLSDIPSGTTIDKVLDFGTSDRLDLRDLFSDAALTPTIAIDNAGAGARVSVSYTEASILHTQDIFVTFDAGVEQNLINNGGIVTVG